jgi:hypothetical protein
MKSFVDYIAQAFNIDSNTSATLVITLSIFILGYLLNWINNIIVGLRTRRNYRKLFQAITDSIIYSIDLQSKNFVKAAKTLNINHQNDYFLQTVTITHLDNVDRLDFKLVYDSYFLGLENLFSERKLKAFNKSFGRLALIKNTEERIPQELSSFIQKFNEHENKWNEAAEQIRQFYDNLHRQVDGGTFPARVADYLTRMDRTIFRWQNLDGRTEYSILHNELINPLLTLNREFQDIGLTLNFNSLLLNASHHFDNMEKTLNVYNEIFRNHSLTYRAANRILKKSISILKTPSIVLFCLGTVKVIIKPFRTIGRRIKSRRK